MATDVDFPHDDIIFNPFKIMNFIFRKLFFYLIYLWRHSKILPCVQCLCQSSCNICEGKIQTKFICKLNSNKYVWTCIGRVCLLIHLFFKRFIDLCKFVHLRRHFIYAQNSSQFRILISFATISSKCLKYNWVTLSHL